MEQSIKDQSVSRHRCFYPNIDATALLLAIAVTLGTQSAAAFDVGKMLGLAVTAKSTAAVVFRGAEQYVKLVPREGDVDNDHPVRLKPADLAQVLRRLRLQAEASADNSAPIDALFTDGEAALLGKILAQGLKRATAKQDLVFVVEGRHGRGRFAEQGFTSGRVFFAHNRLHMILGEVHRTDEQWEAQRKANLAVGCSACPVDSAAVSVALPSRAVASQPRQRVVPLEGLEFMTLNGALRADWVMLDIARLLGASVGDDEKQHKGDEHQTDQVSSRYATAKVAQERRERGGALGHIELPPEGVPRAAVGQALTQ